MVDSKIREALISHDIPNLQINPAVYIDDHDRMHKNYWFLTFTATFDCWERKTSAFIDEPIDGGGMVLYHVDEFRLDEQLLEKKPLKERLLFKIGGAIDALVTVHEKLAPLFRGDGVELRRVCGNR